MQVSPFLNTLMLEHDIENLFAAFPAEFFPGHSFVLRGRQQSFAGIGRFDLLFTGGIEGSYPQLGKCHAACQI